MVVAGITDTNRSVKRATVGRVVAAGMLVMILSGGEAQKIALARALYKDAPFVVLDEPTSALDPIAEFDIYSRFNNMIGGKSAIYISHRLSSCRFCDNVAVFDEGRIVQLGSHNELVADTTVAPKVLCKGEIARRFQFNLRGKVSPCPVSIPYHGEAEVVKAKSAAGLYGSGSPW